MSLLREPPAVRFSQPSMPGTPGSILVLNDVGLPSVSDILFASNGTKTPGALLSYDNNGSIVGVDPATVVPVLSGTPGHVLTYNSEGVGVVGVDPSTLISEGNETGLWLNNVPNAETVHVGGDPVVGGGVLYVDNGVLKYHGAGGTITTLADA